MVDIEVSVETEEQFWDELREILSRICDSHDTIDDSLRSWLHLVSTCRDNFLHDEDDVANCSQLLLESQIFSGNQEYVRTQIIYSLLQEDDHSALNVIANFLLLDGRFDEGTFKQMIEEGCFTKMVELINGRRDDDRRLHRLLLELMYEMARIERLRVDDLLCVDDNFITYMFQLIEGLSDDVNDPYHYPIIRVLLVLNEQYMVASTIAATDASEAAAAAPLTNRVVKILSLYGPTFRTFGENIILLLNRETETSLQLLILKLLYLLFTTKATYEYFYTNDLRVLLDVIIRNLLDLPDESMSLRHTYLRVLYPLLAHTQLAHPPHYKRQEILKVLQILSGEGNTHFAPADETTVRLVDRVSKVRWLTTEASGESEVARKFLGISLSHSQTASSVSVVDVAAVMEKPGVKTPSRSKTGDAVSEELKEALAAPVPPAPGSEGESSVLLEDNSSSGPSPGTPSKKKVLPLVPRHRHGKPTTAPSSSPSVLHVSNGNGHGGGGVVVAKKLPPKTPPPRRTRLKVETTAEAAAAPPVPATSSTSAPG